MMFSWCAYSGQQNVRETCWLGEEDTWSRHPSLKMFEGFPGGSVVKNLPANAGGTGSIPGLGRSHIPQSKPLRHNIEPVLGNKKNHYNEKPSHHN